MIHKTNIILIGFMGCGKTTIGDSLACNLNYTFMDTDKIVEAEAEMSIKQIFETYGEAYFRQLECAVIRKIGKEEHQIIATGGGIIKNEYNINELKKNGIILYLDASPEHIYNNVKDENNRPLLQVTNKMETIKTLLSQRKYLYEEYADIKIDISDKDVETSVKTIMLALNFK